MPQLATTTTARTIRRNSYGALDTATALQPDERAAVRVLLERAVEDDLLPEPYVNRSKREFESLNHHVFDALPTEGPALDTVVVLVLWYWKDLRKERTRMEKTYYLVRQSPSGAVSVTELNGRTCAKRAKNANELGQLTRHYLGLEHVKCATPNMQSSLGYKVVAKTPEGALVSAFDGSLYKPGTWRSEAAQDDHGGGFYYYESEDLAIKTTQRGQTFARCVSEGKSLVLCAVEVSGHVVEYDSGKRAASRLRVLRELGPVEVCMDDD